MMSTKTIKTGIVQVIESIEQDKTEWIVSLTCSNPEAEDCFVVSSKEDAFRIKEMLEKWGKLQRIALEKLADLYDREINFSMSTFWDGGYDVKIGDTMNGFKAEATAEDAGQAIEWIYDKANELYPIQNG